MEAEARRRRGDDNNNNNNNNLIATLWADCLANVGSSATHNPKGLHGLLGDSYIIINNNNTNNNICVYLELTPLLRNPQNRDRLY
jgi:hypothetical protein